jgi:hypothetical protein
MYKIKRLIIECKCGRKLFDENNVELSGDSLLVIVKPCECAAQQSELTPLSPDSLQTAAHCLPDTVLVENVLPAVSG